MDARDAQPTENFPTQPPAQTSTEQPRVVPKLNYHEGHGGAFWIFTIIFVAIASFIIAKKFLFTDKPALTKSQLFDDSSSRLKAAADKVKPVTPPPKPVKSPKPAKSPPKDDDKGKHFEVRV